MHQSVVFYETEFYDSVKIYADNHFVKHVKDSSHTTLQTYNRTTQCHGALWDGLQQLGKLK